MLLIPYFKPNDKEIKWNEDNAVNVSPKNNKNTMEVNCPNGVYARAGHTNEKKGQKDQFVWLLMATIVTIPERSVNL